MVKCNLFMRIRRRKLNRIFQRFEKTREKGYIHCLNIGEYRNWKDKHRVFENEKMERGRNQ